MLAQITYDHCGVVLIAKFVSTLSIWNDNLHT